MKELSLVQQSVVTKGKIWEHHYESIEEILLHVHDECEVRGLDVEQTIAVCDVVRSWVYQQRDIKKGMRDCKAGVYDKWYRYHREDDGAAYDMGWVRQNERTQCENVEFING